MASSSASEGAAGIPGSELPGPFAVGAYAERLRDYLRERARVQLIGEVFNLGQSKAKVYFELRDARGALACSMWRNDFERLRLTEGSLADGALLVVAGGLDYYPGSRTSSPSFTFLGSDLRVAGDGDLLAELARLRRQLADEGLFEPQQRLPRPLLPRTIGVVTGESGKARDDVLAGLRRRGWQGRLVWAFAPVQDRHAAPRITEALQQLAAIEAVETVIIARGGGSLADLFAFCDETLCRTVALLRVPVIASVGHHADRTLIDDVAAVSASTPTHAAEAAVGLDCGEARVALRAVAGRLEVQGRRAVVNRARSLTALSRAPTEHLTRHRGKLSQQLRELRASTRRGVQTRQALAGRHAVVLQRKASAAGGPGMDARRRELRRAGIALSAHDPEQTLKRGYALVEDSSGDPVLSAAAARAAENVALRFADGRAAARVAKAPPK